MENQQTGIEGRIAALPLLALLALASVLGVVVAIALAGVAMLLAAPAYAGEGSLVLERRGVMTEAPRVSAEIELDAADGGEMLVTRIVEVYRNPFPEALGGYYLFRLPPHAVLERLSFAGEAAEARHAVLTQREATALIQPTQALEAGETLVVVLQYRTRAARRLLARGAGASCWPS